MTLFISVRRINGRQLVQQKYNSVLCQLGRVLLGVGLIATISSVSIAAESLARELGYKSSWVSAPNASPVGYKVIAGPRAAAVQKERLLYEQPTIELPTRQPYAYGWFGTQTSPQWTRSFGSARRYTQWSIIDSHLR